MLTSALRSNATAITTVSGSLNSVATTEFRIELYLAVADPSGHGEAQVLLGSKNITTNGVGNKSFAFAIGGLSPGQVLTTIAIRTGTGTTRLSYLRQRNRHSLAVEEVKPTCASH